MVPCHLVVSLNSPASASKTSWPHAQVPALLNLARRLGWVPTFPARGNSETSGKPRYLLKYQVRRLNSASCSQRWPAYLQVRRSLKKLYLSWQGQKQTLWSTRKTLMRLGKTSLSLTTTVLSNLPHNPHRLVVPSLISRLLACITAGKTYSYPGRGPARLHCADARSASRTSTEGFVFVQLPHTRTKTYISYMSLF